MPVLSPVYTPDPVGPPIRHENHMKTPAFGHSRRWGPHRQKEKRHLKLHDCLITKVQQESKPRGPWFLVPAPVKMGWPWYKGQNSRSGVATQRVSKAGQILPFVPIVFLSVALQPNRKSLCGLMNLGLSRNSRREKRSDASLLAITEMPDSFGLVYVANCGDGSRVLAKGDFNGPQVGILQVYRAVPNPRRRRSKKRAAN